MIKTPGKIGWPGKWPWKQPSLMLTFLTPTMRLNRSISIIASTIKKRVTVRQNLLDGDRIKNHRISFVPRRELRAPQPKDYMRNIEGGETRLPLLGPLLAYARDVHDGRMARLLTSLRKRTPEMVRLFGRFVRQESPSDDKAAVDAFGKLVAAEWRRRDARVRVIQTLNADIIFVWNGPADSLAAMAKFWCWDTSTPFTKSVRCGRCRFAWHAAGRSAPEAST